ncbi:MAG: hypothetical protein Q9207_005213 [Kuettlingeria erythrocarpa]
MPHDRRWRSQRIEINNVSFWAFSQEEDKSVSIWASGAAGWFELHDPLPQYRDVFDGMHEAVSMLYYLADKWRRSRKGYVYLKAEELDNYVKSVFRESIHEESGHRLHQQRESKRGKVVEPVAAENNQPKNTLLPHPRSIQHGHRHAPRTRSCSNNGEATHTPSESKKLDGTDTSSDEEYDCDGKLIKPGTKRKSKSTLRPKGSKFSKKGSGRRESLDAVPNDGQKSDVDTGAEDELPEPSPLASVTPREPPREASRQRSQHLPREGPLERSYPYYLPRKVIEVKMVSYDIPIDQPQGPGDVWTCTLENCHHRVHEASKPKGKAHIKEHFQDHARQAQEKIDLALSEARPYLPVR